MAELLEGKRFAEQIRAEVQREVAVLKSRGIEPGLAVVLVGEDPASRVYVNNKHKACDETGVCSTVIRLPENTERAELLKVIAELNGDDNIHGILVQLPLPAGLKAHEKEILYAIRPDKDVDGFHPVNVGKLSIGEEGLVPCTPSGCIRMLEMAGIPIAGKHAVIVGRSNIVGKPMFQLLLARNATVTVCHSRTTDLPALTRQADILVAAVGIPRFITADMVKPGATVIDVGINRGVDNKLVGDVDFGPVSAVAGAITPVPGGVGLLTIAMLLWNTMKAAKIQLQGQSVQDS